jgi:hypothetical protein
MQFKFRSMVAGAAVAAGLALATPATANAQIGFVVQGSYGTEAEAIGIGGGVNFGLGSLTAKHGIRAEATFDYFLVDDPLKFWEINGNLLYDLKSVKNLYLGAGVNYATVDVGGGLGDLCDAVGADCSNSDVGLNVLGGFKLGTGKAAPFVQARFELGGGEQLVISGGFRF